MAPTYPAAHAAAKPIAERFEQKKATTPDLSDVVTPDAASIEQMLTQAFWASLRQEEGRAPKLSLAFVPPERTTRPLTFERPLPLEPEALARLAPAVEGPGIHLGVWRNGHDLSVWGVTRSLPALSFVLEVISAGVLVVKYRRRNPLAKYANVATLEGSDIKFVDQQEAMVADSPALASLLAFYSSAGRQEADNVLVRMAVAMRAHKRGGLLLVVPADTNEWRESVVQPLGYSVNPPFSEIPMLLQPEEQRSATSPNDNLRDAIDALAGLTTVDGATVISDRMDLLGFGIKIVRRQGAVRVEQTVATEPIQGTSPTIVEPAQLGGTRHLAAAQFVHDQRNAISLVASQDGRFTVFAWSQAHNMVHAHRMETLLM